MLKMATNGVLMLRNFYTESHIGVYQRHLHNDVKET